MPYPVASRYVAIWSCSARVGHGAALSALRRSARLTAHPALPPPPSPPQPAPKQEERGRSSASAIATEARRPTAALLLSQDTGTLSPISPGGAPRSSARPPAAPRRAAPTPVRSLPLLENRSFPGSWMNYWRVVNKCEKKAEAPGSASSLRPGKTRLSQSCGR